MFGKKKNKKQKVKKSKRGDKSSFWSDVVLEFFSSIFEFIIYKMLGSLFKLIGHFIKGLID